MRGGDEEMMTSGSVAKKLAADEPRIYSLKTVRLLNTFKHKATRLQKGTD